MTAGFTTRALRRFKRFRRALARTSFVCAVACLPECGDLTTLIRDLGFEEIIPPTKIVGPGSVIYIKSEHPFRTGLICDTPHSLGSQFIPEEYVTQQQRFSKTTKRHFALSADVLSQVRADTGYHMIKNVAVTLSNPKIYIVSDTDVLYNMQYRSEICKAAIANRLRGRFKVTIISETLEGDVSYCITWDNGSHLTAEAKLDVLTNLRAKLKLGESAIRGSCIVGYALVWGVVEDRFLARSTIPDYLITQSSGDLDTYRIPGERIQLDPYEDPTPINSDYTED